ncbi:hypothetical protein TrVE_jg5979 [Triparma verrucosa]|uniref:Fe2OG dioxygenase domain-containing protein n=1 Tax=Triparma verrucosa TaxID=1606542 RepID=A0A9W7EUM8_9STRA|nr:hypothetical protein TrVE_jg5979 [Triparma verrucosa]
MELEEVFERTGAAVYCLQSDDSSDSINQAIDILLEIPPTHVPETGENCDKNYAYAESLPDPSSKKLSSKKRKSPTNTTTSSTADPFLHPSIVLSYAYLSLHLLQPSVTPLSLSLNSWPSNPSSLLLHASNLRSISSLLPSFLAYKKASQTSTSLLPLPQLEFVDLISVEDVINVRSKSTYMACLLGSLLGRHEEVEEMLKGFKVDFRIAPELWRLKAEETNVIVEGSTKNPIEIRDFLPQNYFSRLRDIFNPDAAFWEETDYSSGRYYSYYIPVKDKSDNFFDQLLKYMHSSLGKYYDLQNVKGYEIWAHTRMGGNSLGHWLHYDTDEWGVDNRKIVRHPKVSAVFYLEGEGGETVVFDEGRGWKVGTEANKFFAFEGDKLHGVLPCGGEGRRTTFMVGFWEVEKEGGGRGKGGKDGPWSDLPRAGRRSNWIREIEEVEEEEVREVVAKEPKSVEEAFEKLEDCKGDVEIPKDIDQRFFFPGEGLEYFQKNLFEAD